MFRRSSQLSETALKTLAALSWESFETPIVLSSMNLVIFFATYLFVFHKSPPTKYKVEAFLEFRFILIQINMVKVNDGPGKYIVWEKSKKVLSLNSNITKII